MSDSDAESVVRVRAPCCYFWLRSRIDFYLALVALIVFAPLMLWIAVRIRRDSPGPALFRQRRAGVGAKPFELLKFRTMRSDADPFGDSPQSGDDPRITPLGRRLRETSLDELPQLVNVLRGEMSLVGPRPLYLQQISEWNLRQRCRLLVKPGLTGLAQINGRGGLTLESKLEWDVRYVESACLLADCRIIFATIRSIFGRSGVYEVRYSEKQGRRQQLGNGGR